MSEGYPFCLYVERLTNHQVAVFVQRGSRCKDAKKPAVPDSRSPTLEGNRGVGQIKLSYPVASVIACVL